MNAIDKAATGRPAPAEPDAAPTRTERVRIQYLDFLAGDLDRAMGEAARLGFTAVLLPPPWRPGMDGDRFAPASLDELHPALGDGLAGHALERLAQRSRQHGLALLLDLPLASLAVDFEGSASAFAAVEQADPLDPRHNAPRHTRNPADAAAAGAWWGRYAARFVAAGVAGFRVLGLAEAADGFAPLRAAVPAATLIGWTPGVPREHLARLGGADFVVPSLPWWDGQAEWFWDECAMLRRLAHLLACPETPFGPRVAASVHDPARLGATLRRAAGLACVFGDGWLVPAGFETGARRAMDPIGRSAPASDGAPVHVDLAAMNAALSQGKSLAGGMQSLAGPGSAPMALLQTDAADARFATEARLALLNSDVARVRSIDPAQILPRVGGALAWDGALVPGSKVVLAPGELRTFHAAAAAPAASAAALEADAACHAANSPRVAIEAVTPCVEDGSMPVKRVVGEVVTVSADVICDGHDQVAAVLRWHEPGDGGTHEVRMRPLGNDRWAGELPLTRLGSYEYSIEAWRDEFASFKDELAKKHAAGVEVGLELQEGVALLARAAARSKGELGARVRQAADSLADAGDELRLQSFLSPELSSLMQDADARPRAASLAHPIRIDAERSGAAFAAWYEVFPRSMSDDPNRHGTFRDVERHLPRIRAMGFDVLYFPPVSPIGRVNRKGRNNTLTPSEDDVGSPYAIGSVEGGHDAIHPQLGTQDDFRHLVAAAAGHGIELAIDFAIQCSPDHPWLKQHREWFDWRPDGSIKYAENPPKKYQDIVNVDFYAEGAVPSLWLALAEAVMFWCKLGVRLIRVDNPHTKPLPFWRWMIAAVRERYPDAVFLAEAFTRPKVMYRLAKVGFSQSYSYFTWRETKRDMEDYLTELAEPGPREFFRPHFFVNTPDINPVYLQHAGRSAYLIRAALAATLSGLWGVYNGFELCEGTPLPGREEYLDSEKYQIRAWDWDRPGNIVPEITALNRIRQANPALQSHLTTTFLPAGNDAMSVFLKATPDRSNVLVVAISYDPAQPQQTGWEFPFWTWGAPESAAFEAEDLFTGERLIWRGKAQFTRLDPSRPYTMWRIRALP